PVMVISLPRTMTSTSSNAPSMSRSSSSRWPTSPTMRWLSGTRILTWVDGTVAVVRLPVSARRPAHALPPEHVQVQVGHRVQGVLAHVEDQAVAAVCQSLGGGDRLCGRDHLGQHRAV